MVQIKKSWAMGLGIALGLFFSLSLSIQGYQLWQFVHRGARFTAADGQVLCERVRELETRSYGYRDAGESPLPCVYLQR